MDYKISNFYIRLLVSIPLIIISFITIYLGSKYLFYYISFIFLIIFIELNILFLKNYNYKIILQSIILTISFILIYINIYLFFLMSIFYLFISLYLIKESNHKFLYVIINLYLFISLYSAFNLLYLNFINSNILIFLFLLIISFDSFSYFFGKLLKGKKIVPNISPGKTISGYIGGLISSFFIGILFNLLFPIMENFFYIFVIIFITLLSAIIGDLLESIIKRKLYVKDSSNFLPGHGGFFDRFDAFIFVFIVFNFSYLILLN